MYLFFGPEYDTIDTISYIQSKGNGLRCQITRQVKEQLPRITAQPHCVNIIEAAKDKVGDPGLVTAVIIRSNHIEPGKNWRRISALPI